MVDLSISGTKVQATGAQRAYQMGRFLRRRFRRVLVDVDTQYDLFVQANHDATALLGRVRRLMAWARQRHVPVVSTALSRPYSVSTVRTPGAPDACIEGTPGQQKLRYTTLPVRVVFGAENRFDLPRNLLEDYQQVIFEKRSADPFAQPRADRLLTDLKADEFVVFGMGTSTAVKATVLGLLHRGKRVLVVYDAVERSDRRATTMALRQMEAKGARMVTTEYLTGQSHLRGAPVLRVKSASAV